MSSILGLTPLATARPYLFWPVSICRRAPHWKGSARVGLLECVGMGVSHRVPCA